MRRADRAAALVLFAFAIFALNEARKLRFGTVSAPGPGFVPLCLAMALAVVSFALVVTAWRSEIVTAASRPSANRPARLRVIGTMLALVIYTFALEPVGFVIATAVLLGFFFRALERQRWWVALLAAVGTSFVTDVVFARWLQVRLPPGLWGL